MLDTKKRVIFLDAPFLQNREKDYLCRAIDTGYVSSIGPFVPEFEKKIAGYLKAKEAVAVQSGTAALHIALYELGIGPGDEVIVPALTFVATVNPILYVGAKPIFVDSDYETWTIDPEKIERAITKHTKAIIPVHLYGNPCNMNEIMQISNKYNLYVIEDATESLGAKFKKKFTGTFGDLGCFSFNGNKIITTGGGGMVVGNDQKRLKHIRFLVNQARESTAGYYYHPEVGFNYRMTNIEAALGLAQMEKLDEFLQKKRKFNAIYREELNSKIFCFQKQIEEAESSFWLTCVIIEKDINIKKLQNELLKYGIQTRRIFTPVVEFPMYRDLNKEKYKYSYQIYEKGLCLPSSCLNSEEDIYFVCKILKDLIV